MYRAPVLVALPQSALEQHQCERRSFTDIGRFGVDTGKSLAVEALILQPLGSGSATRAQKPQTRSVDVKTWASVFIGSFQPQDQAAFVQRAPTRKGIAARYRSSGYRRCLGGAFLFPMGRAVPLSSHYPSLALNPCRRSDQVFPGPVCLVCGGFSTRLERRNARCLREVSRLFIPVRPAWPDVWALADLSVVIRDAQQRGQTLKPLVVWNQYQGQDLRPLERRVLSDYRLPLHPRPLPQHSGFADLFTGKPLPCTLRDVILELVGQP